MKVLVLYLCIINIIAFLLMGIDKRLARKQARRISERNLFIPVLLGGGVGGCFGMRAFHHKTKHMKFQIGFPLITILEISAAMTVYVALIS